MDAIVQSRAGNAAEFFVDRHVREGRGAKPAFVDERRSLSYGEFCAETQGFAAGLERAGVRREARIALLILDHVEFPVCFWGAIRAGVVPIPINTLLPPDLTTYILADSRAELVGDETTATPEWLMIRNLLTGKPQDALKRAHKALSELFSSGAEAARRGERIALIGLRGAG